MIEPVAHRFKWEEKMSWQYGDGYDATGAPNDPDYFAYEPLYTHPTKELDEQFKKGFEAGKEEGWKAHKFHHPAKTLTDDEIYKIANSIEKIEPQHGLRLSNDLNVMDFARAILRKASEK